MAKASKEVTPPPHTHTSPHLPSPSSALYPRPPPPPSTPHPQPLSPQVGVSMSGQSLPKRSSGQQHVLSPQGAPMANGKINRFAANNN
jgi:hypothetical protein